TGLIWSRGCSGIGCADFSQGSLKEDLTRYSWDNTHGNNGGLTSSELCASGTHGETGWRLPHQKQLMQAYINGSFANIADISVWMGSMWSATTVSWNTDYAWQVHLSHGYTRPRFKNTPSDDTNHSYIICVR
ncbi:MAG: DUF1566 domain-containing protein, partial [bacterium]|nr:DUF1566 domain-containing protein [bacterium]